MAVYENIIHSLLKHTDPHEVEPMAINENMIDSKLKYKEQLDPEEEYQPRCIIQRPSLLLWADVEKPEHRTDLLNGKSHENGHFF